MNSIFGPLMVQNGTKIAQNAPHEPIVFVYLTSNTILYEETSLNRNLNRIRWN